MKRLSTGFDREAQHVELSLAFLRDEIHRREQDSQTKTIRRLTWAITAMTLVVTIATVINVLLFARV